MVDASKRSLLKRLRLVPSDQTDPTKRDGQQEAQQLIDIDKERLRRNVIDELKGLDEHSRDAIAWLAAEYKFLLELYNHLRSLSGTVDIQQEVKASKDMNSEFRSVKRSERRVNRDLGEIEQNILKLEGFVKSFPSLEHYSKKLFEEDKVLHVDKNELLKAFSYYSGNFNRELIQLRALIQLRKDKLGQHQDASGIEKEIQSKASSMAQYISTLLKWSYGLQVILREVDQNAGSTRRELLRTGVAAGVGVAVAPHLLEHAPTIGKKILNLLSHLVPSAYAQGALTLKYVDYNGKTCLPIIVRKGMGYAHIAKYALAAGHNYRDIQSFNKNKKLQIGDKVYVPMAWLTLAIRKVLEENVFQTYTLDEGDNLSNIVKHFLDVKRFGYEDTFGMVVIINSDINMATLTIYEGGKMILPSNLFGKDIIVEPPKKDDKKTKITDVPSPRKKPTPERPKTGDDALIERMTRYQNPYHRGEAEVWGTIRPGDKFGSFRAYGGRINPLGHGGLDFPAEVGTALYPMGVGRVTEIRDYEHPKQHFWRNGKVIEIKTAFGYVTKYLHLSKFRPGLRVGDVVDLDTVIGYVGISGNASADNPHVHVQIKTPSGKVINPEPFARPSTNSGKRLKDELLASITRNKDIYLNLFRKADQDAL